MKNEKVNILSLSTEELILNYISLVNQRDLVGVKVFNSINNEDEKNIKQLEKQIVIITLLLKKMESILEKNNIDKNKILNNKYFSLRKEST